MTSALSWENYNHYLSKSRLNTFSFCPLQFKKLYIDNVKKIDPNYAMTTGTRLHEFFDRFFEFAPNYPVDKWEDFIHPDFNEQEREQIKWFINQERDRLELYKNDFNKWIPVAREYKILDHEHEIRAIIDRIDMIGDSVCIIEYKTGKSFYKPSLQKELGFYKFILQSDPKFAGKDCIGCVINPRLQIIEFISPSRESTIIKEIQKLRDAIDTGVFEPTCTGSKFAICRMCNSCEEANLYQPRLEIA